MLGEETTGLEHLEPKDGAASKDIAQKIVDLLVVEDANVDDTLTALSIVLCFTIQLFEDPMEVLEGVYDEIVGNLAGEFGDAIRAQEATPEAAR